MALTDRQKDWINKNKYKFSSSKIAKELKVLNEDVEKYLLTLEKTGNNFFYLK